MRIARILLSFILLPLSLLFGFIVYLRNRMYDYNILKSRSFSFPVIAIGNITVGGTGKTPHVEYMAELLKDEFRVATLSRGYKRKTSGFHFAQTDSLVKEVGDEPLQVKNKFPDIPVAVDRNRVRGIELLKSQVKDLDVVLLDDGFQHRKVKPNLSILLISFHHPIHKDWLLPLGNLREQVSEKRRAGIIIVTKSPADLQPIQRRVLLNRIKPYPYQNVYFTTFEYGKPLPVFPGEREKEQVKQGEAGLPDEVNQVLLVTAIADPQPLKNYLEEKGVEKIYSLKFADHRNFSPLDIEKIKRRFERVEGEKVIITTEKDAVRLRESIHVSDELKKAFFYIPIRVKFLNNRTDDFNTQILEYVRKNKKHSFLYPQQD